MAVYEANTRSLANFISDTKLGFMPIEVSSTTGRRVDEFGSQYSISAHEIKIVYDSNIYVVNDCFIDIEGNIFVNSYIPSYIYYLKTNELSPCYGKGEHLPFGFKVDSQVVTNKIEKDIEIKSYNDFKSCLESIILSIEKNIENSINEFQLYKDNKWKIEDVVCDITWQVDRIKK